ncbi:MAG: hypothetical protein HQM07_09735 [Zetaproteobacteria bacterium]|nr:hypothetical protein [Zetaproteobacteria bacterium]
MKSIVVFCLSLLLLTGCISADEPLPEETIHQLTGAWQQTDGTAEIRFYADESVKLTRRDQTPPLKVLSVLEFIKDQQIGFGIGDRWTGPVHVIPAEDWQSLKLIFPGDDPSDDAAETLIFIRSQLNQ